MNDVFYCKSKRLADYLVKNGSKLVNSEFQKGKKVFVFVKDESIDKGLALWEANKKRWLF